MKAPRNKRLMGKRNPRRNRQRFGGFFLFILVGIFLLFVFRFSYIVVSGHANDENLTKKASALYQSSSVLRAKRGTIYDASGTPIAEDTTTYSIYAVLDKNYTGINDKKLYVTDKAKVAKVLSQYLPLDRATILRRLNPANSKTFQVEFGTAGSGLSLTIKQAIEKADLKGVYFTETPARLYPNGIFASHQIGLANAKTTTTANTTTSNLKGIMGLEKTLNSTLTGTNGVKKVEKDSYGYQLPNTKAKEKAAKNGKDVYLTLDSRLQTYLETLMSSVQTKYQPEQLNAVLMNPKTGQILAASQRPTFNPETGSGLGNFWRDTLVGDAYEPGSVMKAFTLAAAIDSGKYQPNSTYQSGQVTVGGTTVHDWNNTGWGTIPLSKAFPLSSNVGFVHIEETMGKDKWLSYLNKFQFMSKTKSLLSGEVSGSIQYEHTSDQAVTSFGQGINVTMMQMMQGFSAIANDGKEMQPQIVSKVTDPATGKTTKYKPKQVATPIKKSTAKQVLAAMEDVTYKDYGTGGAYKIPGYKIATKTGTAQISNANGGGYMTGDSNYIFSVVGMAPASNPKYVLYITMKQPQKMTDPATEILAQIFNPLMKRALDYDAGTTATESKATMPNVTGQSVSAATAALKKQNLTTVQIGTGNTVVQQMPLANEVILDDQRALILTNGAMTMPDVTGWSKSDVLKLAELTGKKITIKGTGYATKQSLAAKGLLNSAQSITVTLSKP
ncbi:penicillin-binding protein [Loigolactobacillus jiayinensis]|uniref:Penicillin-binding protein n=1 Tax=Loigolactobacillus jiayinensis TaxID=2486016 RepID=A0ABW1RGF0_9LACO|nr:penicillin-binding protein [Loigolactobacillus jiayinensis]